MSVEGTLAGDLRDIEEQLVQLPALLKVLEERTKPGWLETEVDRRVKAIATLESEIDSVRRQCAEAPARIEDIKLRIVAARRLRIEHLNRSKISQLLKLARSIGDVSKELETLDGEQPNE